MIPIIAKTPEAAFECAKKHGLKIGQYRFVSTKDCLLDFAIGRHVWVCEGSSERADWLILASAIWGRKMKMVKPYTAKF